MKDVSPDFRRVQNSNKLHAGLPAVKGGYELGKPKADNFERFSPSFAARKLYLAVFLLLRFCYNTKRYVS